MGGLTSAIAPILQVGSAIAGIAKPYYKDSLDRNAVDRQNALSLEQARGAAAIQKQTNALNAQAAETDRRSLLARTLAKQRAEFGDSGTGSDGGSAGAVLQGLFQESDDERKLREQSAALKDSAIDLNLANQNQTDLLQRSLLQRQQAFNRITDVI